MDVELLRRQDAVLWNRFVKKSGELGFDLDVKVLYESAYGLKPMYYVFKSGSRIKGALPSFEAGFFGRHLVSLPFYNISGGLLAPDSLKKKFVEGLVENERARRTGFIHIKTSDVLGHGLLDEFNINRFVCAYESILKLGSDVHLGFDKDVRRQIRKADGVKLVPVTSADELAVYHRLLSIVHMRQHKTLSHPFIFYKRLFDLLVPRGLCSIFLLCHHHIFIGGLMVYRFNGEAVLADIFSLKEYFNLRPQHNALSQVIDWLVEEKYAQFSMGPSFLDMKGVLFFKESWGAKRKLIYSYVVPVNKNPSLKAPLSDSFKRTRNLLSLIPYPLLKNSSGLILRNFA